MPVVDSAGTSPNSRGFCFGRHSQGGIEVGGTPLLFEVSDGFRAPGVRVDATPRLVGMLDTSTAFLLFDAGREVPPTLAPAACPALVVLTFSDAAVDLSDGVVVCACRRYEVASLSGGFTTTGFGLLLLVSACFSNLSANSFTLLDGIPTEGLALAACTFGACESDTDRVPTALVTSLRWPGKSGFFDVELLPFVRDELMDGFGNVLAMMADGGLWDDADVRAFSWTAERFCEALKACL